MPVGLDILDHFLDLVQLKLQGSKGHSNLCNFSGRVKSLPPQPLYKTGTVF